MGEPIPEHPPEGCTGCIAEMPDEIHVIMNHPVDGLFWGWIPKTAPGVYSGDIHNDGMSFIVSVYFCNYEPDTASIDSLPCGWKNIEGVGCDSFIGLTDGNCPFWVGVED